MARGRRGQAAEIKEAKGNPGRRPVKTVSAGVLPHLPAEPPADITHKRARQIWAEYSPKLNALGFLRETDGALFAMFTHTYALFLDAADRLKREGMTYAAPSDHSPDLRRRHPMYSVLRDARRDLIPMIEKLGMTPGMRADLMTKIAASGMPLMTDSDEENGRPGDLWDKGEGEAAPDNQDPANFH